jgi:hypothetical protein
MRALPILLLAVALSGPAPVAAAGLTPWIGVGGSLGTYSMGDVNSDLDVLNKELAVTGLHLASIDGGPGCGASAGVDLWQGLSIGVGYERLFGSSGVQEPGLLYFRYRVPADAFRGMVEYALPRKGPLGMRLGVAAGRLRTTGQIVSGQVYGVQGAGPLFEAYLGADWWGQPRCGLTGAIGYRSARVDEVTIDGRVAEKFKLDYSGTLLRLGLKVPLGAPAGGPGPFGAGGARPWVSVDGSWGGYQMVDTNHDLLGIVTGTDADGNDLHALKEIHGGFGFGGSAGLDFPGHLTLGIGFDRLSAASKGAVEGGTLEYRLPAHAIRGIAEYRVTTKGRLAPRLGVAGGAVMEAGPAGVEVPGAGQSTVTHRLQGSGLLLEAYGGCDWRTGPRLAVTAAAGYRHAKAGEVKVDGTVFMTAAGKPYVADYSGPVARLGLKYTLTK